jgi:membrane-bound lytic murein transglycosylase MltF
MLLTLALLSLTAPVRFVVHRSAEDVPRASAPVFKDLTLADAFTQAMGATSTVTDVEEPRDAVKLVREDQADFIISPLVGLGDAPQGVVFSRPVRRTNLVIVAKKGGKRAASLAEVRKVYSFIDFSAALAQRDLKRSPALDVEVSWEVDDQTHVMQRVAAGEFQYGMVLEEEAAGFMAYRSDIEIAFKVMEVPLVWAAKDQTKLAQLNAFLAKTRTADATGGDWEAVKERHVLRVALPNGPLTYFADRGVSAGFYFSVVSAFATSAALRLEVVVPNTSDVPAQLLSSGAVDLAYSDSPALFSSTLVTDKTTGRFAARERSAKDVFDGWLATWRGGSEYKRLVDAYFSPVVPGTELAKTGATLSPFDSLVQRLSAQYGFDWKLITAQMFHESRFNPNARSPVGALGLMQVMPKTGRSLGFTNLAAPEEGAHAGIKYLSQMKQRWSELSDPKEITRFALASYNAGLGHVLDARALARERGRNPDVFTDVAEMFLLLQDKAVYSKARHGYCRGKETVGYVRKVDETFARYSAAE